MTRRGWWMLLIAGSMLFASILKNINLLLFTSSAILGVLALGWLLKTPPPGDFILETDPLTLLPANNPHPLKIRFICPRLLGRPLAGELHLEIDQRPTLLEKFFWNHAMETDFTASLPPLARGSYQLDRVVARDLYPFGLFRRDFSCPIGKRLRVYPEPLNPVPLHRMIRRTMERGSQFKRSVADSFLPHHPRPFQPADSPKRIDWKIFARTGELMVFQETAHEPRPLSVHIHTGFFKLPGEYENGLRLLATFVQLAIDERLEIRLSMDGESYRLRGHDNGEIDRIRSALAAHRFNPTTRNIPLPADPCAFLLLPLDYKLFFAPGKNLFRGVILWVGSDNYTIENRQPESRPANTRDPVFTWDLS